MKLNYKVKKSNKGNILERICENRGVDYNQLDSFLNPSKECVGSYLNYENILMAFNSIEHHIKNNNKICVVVDSDVDGYCSAAILISYIKKVFNYNNFFIVFHLERTHGLTEQIMQEIINSNVDLVIIPDAGTNDFEQHEILASKKIEVVVLDHHEAINGYSNHAIVVNNHLSPRGNKNLCGAGVVMKLLECFDDQLSIKNSEEYYDLLAVALVGDIMKLNDNETRYYTNRGLRNINNALLFELYRGGKVINYESVSFEIAPTINAFIRVATKDEKVDLFNALLGLEEEKNIAIRGKGDVKLTLAEYIGQISSRIKRRQTNMIKAYLEDEEAIIYEEGLFAVVVLLKNAENINLNGLIANRVSENFNKPALVLKKVSDIYRGSARTIDTYRNFKDYCNSIGVFEFAKGHQEAFGVVIKEENISKLLEILKKSYELEDLNYLEVDKAYKDFVSAYEIIEVSNLNNHWSHGFEKPRFYIELNNVNVEVIGIKGDTIRIKKDNITYVKFKCSEEEITTILNKKIESVELIGTFEINEWMDKIYPQVFIEKMNILKSSDIVKDSFFGTSFESFSAVKW